MSAHVFTNADYVRLVTLAICMAAIASFPYAVSREGRSWRAWLAVAGCELFMLGAMVGIADHFGHEVVWYRTPLSALAGSLVLIFNVLVFMANRKDLK